jgi:SAM-dependent methyltransferase
VPSRHGWTKTLLPRLSAFALGGRTLAADRADLVADARGRVLEVGIGSGTSIRYYPRGVHSLLGLDTSHTALRTARRKPAAAFPVGLVRAAIEQAPLRTGSFDYAVTTWLLCLLPDPVAALGRVRELLAPGGTLLFLEHGRAGSQPGRRLQATFTPVARRLCGGCRLDREIGEIVTAAGFRIEHMRTRRLGPADLITVYMGSAVAAGGGNPTA